MTYKGFHGVNPDAYYEPNSFGGPVEVPAAQEPPLPVSGLATRQPHQQRIDDYTQVRALYETVLTQPERDRLHANVAASMTGVPAAIIDRALGHFHAISPAYAAGIRAEVDRVKAEGGEDVPGAALEPAK